MLYGILFLNFANIYFFRNPIYNPEGFNFSSRILAKYISIANLQSNRVLVMSPEASSLFENYLFYTNYLGKDNVHLVVNLFNTGKYQLNNVEFISCSTPTLAEFDGTLIISTHPACKPLDRQHLTIPRLSDAGALFHIYNDKVCQNIQMSSYPSNIKFSDFNLEKISMDKFCEEFMTNLQ